MSRRIPFFSMIIIFSQFLVVGISSPANITLFTISPSTITLPDQAPDVYPEISSPVNLSVAIATSGITPSRSWTLDIYASQNFISGINSIPIGNGRWTVTGTDPTVTYSNGTFSLNQYITTATDRGNANLTLYFRFYLKNYWTYATGNYSSTITLRLTVPGNVATRTFTLSVALSGRAKLNLGMAALNFPDSNPNTVPTIPANVNPVSVTSSSRTGSSLTTSLSCLASGDLRAGTSSIPISNVTWQSSGSGFVPGTMSKTTSQPAGSWTGSGVWTGTFSYFLNNSWSYDVGIYSTTVFYTLTAP